VPLLRWIQNGKDVSSDTSLSSGLCRFMDEPPMSYGVWDPCINTQSDVGDDYTCPIWGLVRYRNGTNVFVSSDTSLSSGLCRFMDEPPMSYGVWDPCINTQPDVGDDYTGPIRWLVSQYRNGTDVFMSSDRLMFSDPQVYQRCIQGMGPIYLRLFDMWKYGDP
jgi:hypothetical protein